MEVHMANVFQLQTTTALALGSIPVSGNSNTAKPRPEVSGRSLAHTTKLDKRQLACIAAQDLLGEVPCIPTLRQHAAHFCPAYLAIALAIPRELRAAIAAGENDTPFAELANFIRQSDTAIAAALATAFAIS
jgi:hypothetical protein